MIFIKKNNFIFAAIFWFAHLNLNAQINLVPNYSFDQIDSCPNYVNKIAFAQPWFSAYHSEVSTDLFDTCSNNFVSVPNNFAGLQYPRTGKSYAGIIAFRDVDYREYLEVKLQSQLINGRLYCVNYYVSLAGNSYSPISNMGLKFSSDSLTISSPFIAELINVLPDIENPLGNYLTDTLGWQSVSGQYTALGNENFITIGNFRDDSNSDTLFYSYNQFIGYGAYYYIDDVSVVEVSPANAGNDTTICTGDIATIGGLPTFEASYNWYALNGSGNISIDSANISKPHVNPIVNTTYVMQKTQCSVTTYDTVVVSVNCVGINEYLNNKNKEAVYPNPNNGVMQANIRLNIGEKGEIVIYNLLGKQLANYNLVEGKNDFEIDESNLESGVYFYRITINGIIKESKKLIIVK